MVTDHGENYGDNDDSRQSPSSSRNYLDSNLPFESSLRSPHCHSPISPPMHNPTDTSGSSQPASPATPVGDPSTKLSAMQTVQTYLTQETQAIQTHLTTVLPGLIQDEVRTQCSQLAQEISGQISSLRKEVLSPTGDQDDPMSPSIEGEGENEHSSGRGKRSARHSRDKGKKGARRFATEDDKANNGDEPDEDEGGENESTDEMSGGRRKYKKQAIVLRVSNHILALLTNTDRMTVGATTRFPPTERGSGEGGKWFSCFTATSLCPCYPRHTIR